MNNPITILFEKSKPEDELGAIIASFKQTISMLEKLITNNNHIIASGLETIKTINDQITRTKADIDRASAIKSNISALIKE